MDEGEKKAFEEMMKSLDNLGKIVEKKLAEVRNYLSSKTIEEMKQIMREFDIEALKTCCEQLKAIENENYEICQAAQEVLNEKLNNEKIN